jgi:amino acid adenylation domain-containing protein/FkbH-like protein
MKRNKKIKNLKSLGIEPGVIKGNIPRPGNDYVEFKKEDIRQSIARRFEEQAKTYPGRIAVKTLTLSLTYDALNAFANRTAHAVLAARGGKDGLETRCAALLFGHGAGMIVGILGVLKSGKFYVPLDAAYPLERLVYMLENSGAGVIVTDRANKDLAVRLKNKVDSRIKVIDIDGTAAAVSTENPGAAISPGDMAYILYTSGSTGRPKGVMQNQRNVLHFARVYTNALHIHKDDKLTLLSSYSFDAAKMDIYGALLNGAALYPYDIKAGNNLQRLPEWLREEGITIYHSIPTVYRYFTGLVGEPGLFPRLRLIVLGGEPVFKKDVEVYKKYFSDFCLFINGLGPTESTVTLQYFMDKNSEITREAVPVGFAVDETRVFLLDGHDREVGAFGVGEIVFASDYLATGYWKNPEQTRNVFMPNPLTGQGRIYRTGDLGRRLADGALEYAGRKDFQVKISGYRVEVEEIESKLDRVPGIKKSVVVCKSGDNRENYLAAFYTTTNDISIDENHLAGLLKDSLPDYMIPAVFFHTPAFPLTPIGKVDRMSLVKMDISHLLPEIEYEPPGSETESILVEIWRELLKVDKIGINENFFVLGGNSLKAVLLVSRVHKALAVKIPLAEIFKRPTIKELAAFVCAGKPDIYEDIRPVEKRDYYPLSSAQKRLFFLGRFEDVGTAFNMPIGLRIKGVLDVHRYGRIFKSLIRRHETLRTSFHLLNDQPVQRVHDAVEFKIKYCLATEDIIRPFDLARAPLFRVGIVTLSPEEHYLYFDAHHIVFDGASTAVLADDFKRLYEDGEPEPLKIQYKDFAGWQNRLLTGGKIKTGEDYWLNLYSDALNNDLPELSLPADYPRPAVMNYEGDNYSFILDGEETRALKEMALENDVSLYMLLLAVYDVFLAKITGQDDIIVITIISGRNHADTEKIPGVFVNMLAMRNYPEGEKSFPGFLREVGNSTLRAFENRDYQFETLVEKLPGTRDIYRHPLTDVGFTLQNLEAGPDPGSDELQFVSLKSQRKTARNDLNLEGFEIGDRLRFDFQYRTGLFKKETAAAFAGYFRTLLGNVIKQPGGKIKDLELITGEEKHRLLFDFNTTRKEYPGPGMTIHCLFEEQAQRTPGAAAACSSIEFKNIYDRLKPERISIELTYGELDERAGQLAGVLRARGLRAGGMVGLMVRHPLEVAVSIWGILKAGGAYLPIDPAYSRDVKQYILDDSRVRLLVTEEELMGELPDLPAAVTVILTDDYETAGTGSFNPAAVSAMPDLAYVIYTSGTTGRPKGVLVSHEGIVNYTLWRLGAYGYSRADVTLQPLSYSFDGFGANFYSALVSGGMLVMVPEDKRTDGDYLKEVVIENRVTNVSLVPGIYRLLLESMDNESLQGLRLVVLAGETSGEALIKQSREKAPHILLANEYGPTEAAVTVTSRFPIAAANTALIGGPIANRRVYILDRWLNPVPLMIPGELCAAGSGIARGYLNNPELTNEKFLRGGPGGAVFSKSAPPGRRRQKLYKTGDLARWLPDGNIEFLGRLDHQVKVRGYRIELQAIEAHLAAHENIKEAVAVVREENDNKYICVYIVLYEPRCFSSDELKNYLSARLAYYMVPSRFVPLEKIPLTPGGKVDRGALPRPEAVETGTGFAVPATALEKKLAELWAEALDVDKEHIGLHTNFFELGGHSLKAAQLVSRVHEALDIKIPQAEIFKTPTIHGLVRYMTSTAGAVDHRFEEVPAVEKKEYYGLSSAQLRMYILQQMTPGNTAYNMPFARLLEKEPDKKRLERAFRELIHRHESLRTCFCLARGNVVQRIHDTVTEDTEDTEKKEKNRRKGIHHLVGQFIRPFDLSRAPLLRVGLMPAPGGKCILMVDMHHIISDGISHQVLFRDFTALYGGRQLPPLRLQYKDYARWQRQFFQSGAFKRQETYWLERFSGGIPVLRMPLDFHRPLKQSFEGRTLVFTIPGDLVEKLTALAVEQGLSLNILVLSLYTLLLNKYSDQRDITVGSLVAGRGHPDLEKIIGMFANFLPLGNRVEPRHTFSEFLGAAGKNILDAYNNQDYPFEKLIDLLDIPVDLSRNALFDTMVVFHNQGDFTRGGEGSGRSPGPQENHGLNSVPYIPRDQTSTLDFKLDVSRDREDPGSLRCRLQYDARLFKEESMNCFIGHFKRLAAVILDNPGERIGEIELFTTEEKREFQEKRKRGRGAAGKPLTVALCASFTAEPAADYIKWWGGCFNLDIETVFAPYNQVFQELLDENGLLSTNRGIDVLFIRFEDWIRELAPTASLETKCRVLEENFNRLLEIFKAKTGPKTGLSPYLSPYFVGIFPVSAHLSFGPDLTRYLEELNKRWRAAAAAVDNVYVLDFTSLAGLYRVEEVFDPVTDRAGHVPFSSEYYAAVGTAAARAVCALNGHPFKVIALDCDNTLWKGICGEDGAAGVRVEGPYLGLQRFMLQKYHEGMLLTLCSKNNEADVWEVFAANPGMPLKKEHFVDWQIDWGPKSRGLEALADRLNVGIDSFILVDDSPVECAEVMSHRPGVLTLRLPGNPEYIPLFLKHAWAFDRLKVTGEDRVRSKMYRAEQDRRQSRETSISRQDFLAGLELKVGMNPMKPHQAARVSQLTQRTNQFNLSTRRRSEKEIAGLGGRPGTRCWVIEVSDRFGDYGLVGVVITVAGEPQRELFIDTLLLSCRVLGRGVEEAVLVGLKNICIGSGLQRLTADYYPTPKNKPVLTFLQNRWNSGPAQQGQTAATYTLAADDIPAAVEYVDFFYLRTFKEDENNGAGLKPPPVPAGSAPADFGNRRSIETNGETQWELAVVNRDRLVHRSYLLPLEHYTAARLCRLPVGQKNKGRKALARVEYEAPRDRVEEILADIWSGLLDMDRNSIGTAAGFFDLGGSSMGIIRMISGINRAFAVEMPVERLFSNVTVKEIAAYIKENKKGAAGEEPAPAPPMLLNDAKPGKVFLFPPIIGYGIGYRALAKYIDNISLYAFNYIGDEDKIKRYAGHIIAVQAKGPYVLGGYSAGGNLAFEVTRELENQGHDVSAIIMLDTFPKDFPFSYGVTGEHSSFQNMVDGAMASMGLAFLKEEVREKSDHYSRYYNRLVNRGTVKAAIYSITAADREEREYGIIAKETGKPGSRQFPGWEKYTSGTCRVYRGFGTHADMFTPGNVEKNAEIVRDTGAFGDQGAFLKNRPLDPRKTFY